MPVPLLILSDSANAPTGLGRITRDIATIAAGMPEFRTATLGYGGSTSRHLPFQQYPITSLKNWVVEDLPSVWNDFAGQEKGILFTIWDASRVEWMTVPPETLPFYDFMLDPPFKLWTYTPVDASGPHGKLSQRLQATLMGFDRVLNYTKFSADVTGYPDHLPHGIHTGVFRPIPNGKSRFRKYGFTTLKDESLLIGIVATNQVRKDWALGIQTAAELKSRGHDVRLWCHIDTIGRHWDIAALLTDYGLFDQAAVTTSKFPDEQMAELYSACDVTLGIGSEGFGYPIAESLACGTPVVTGNYSGQTDYVPRSMLVEPVGYRYDTIYCWKRAVYRAEDWADKVEANLGATAELPSDLDWINLAPRWQEWLKAGIE